MNRQKYESENKTNLKQYFEDFKSRILDKLRKAKIKKKRKEDFEKKENGNKVYSRQKENQILFLNKIIFLEKNLEHNYDKLLFIFDWDNKLIEILFEQNENHPNKLPKGKIQIRFDSISKISCFSVEESRITLNTKYIKIYKEGSNKKGATWEKSAINSFKIFQRVNTKKIEFFEFNFFFPKEEFEKFYTKKYFDQLQKNKVKLIQVNKNSNIFKLIGSEKKSELAKVEKDLKKDTKKEKVEKFNKIICKVTKYFPPNTHHCPIYFCQENYNNVNLLRNHITKIHPEIFANKMQIDDQGIFSYPDHLLDNMIMVCKMIPGFMRDVVLHKGKEYEKRLNRKMKH